MDDSFRVRRVQCVGNLDSQLQYLLKRQWLAGNAVLQCLPIEKLHDDEGPSVLVINLMDGTNVCMIQGRGGFGLALQAANCLRVSGDIVGKELQRDKAIQFDILGFVNHAHASTTEPCDDAVV